MGVRTVFVVSVVLQFLLLLSPVHAVDGGSTDGSTEATHAFVLMLTSVIMTLDPVGFGVSSSRKRKLRSSTGTHRSRERRSVHSMMHELGPYYTRRAYRMDEQSFWVLHALLLRHMGMSRKPLSKKVNRNGAKNGLIPSATRLSAALRYFAGGRPDDIALSHGISHSNVFKSVWKVVDAINKCPELSIIFPTDHSVQRSIARGFKEKSKAGFACCVGAIDGILIWIEKPNGPSCEEAQCGPRKFFCGRKKKHGMNMQAVCDHTLSRQPEINSDFPPCLDTALVVSV